MRYEYEMKDLKKMGIKINVDEIQKMDIAFMIESMLEKYEFTYKIQYFMMHYSICFNQEITNEKIFNDYLRKSRKELRRFQEYGKDYENIILKKWNYRKLSRKLVNKGIKIKSKKI